MQPLYDRTSTIEILLGENKAMYHHPWLSAFDFRRISLLVVIISLPSVYSTETLLQDEYIFASFQAAPISRPANILYNPAKDFTCSRKVRNFK